MDNERVLIIILAETRANDLTFRKFKANLLSAFKADLALCIADNLREDTGNPFYSHAKYVWTCKEPEDWGIAFDEAQKSLNLSGNWRRLLEIKNQWLGGIRGPNAHPGSGGILLYFRWFLKHCLLKSDILDQYDRFVITRSDYMHDVPHVPLRLLSPNYIWIPYGESYGGYTDRHIVVSRMHILSVLSIADPILTTPETLFEKMKYSQHWNLELYIKFAFGELGLISLVRNFPFTMYTVRSVTGHTRWRAGIYNEKLGYCIKYKGEYIRARFAAKCIKRTGQWNPLIMWFLMRSIELLHKVARIRRRLKKTAVLNKREA